MSSRSLLRRRRVVRPGGGLVVEGAGLEASVLYADEAVGELAQGGVVPGAAAPLVVVVGAGSGGGVEGSEGLAHEGVDEPVVVHVPGQHGLLLAGGAGDGAGAGIVLAGFGGGVAARVVAGFCEHPGAEDRSQPGLGGDDLSVRVLPKIGLHLPLQDWNPGLETRGGGARKSGT